MTATAPKFDVFFSYDHDDEEWMRRLSDALRARGIRIWVDASEIRPADRWAERLESGLKSSRVYALIVTRRAMQSRWVQDEYLSALALANSGTDLQLLPLLIEDVKLPLFLSIRQYVDFRDPARFEQSLEDLHRTLLASRAADSAPAPVLPEGERSASAESQNRATVRAELEFIERALHRESRTVREMRIVQIAAALLGFVAYTLLAGAKLLPEAGVLALGGPLFTGLVGWGATVRRISAARSNQDRLNLLRDGLGVCEGRRESWCDTLQREFWKTVHGNFGA
jgi:hypothetical protein